MPFSATALRGATTTKDAQRILQGNKCTINSISYLQIPDAEPIPGKLVDAIYYMSCYTIHYYYIILTYSYPFTLLLILL